jgi:hypothetical protein
MYEQCREHGGCLVTYEIPNVFEDRCPACYYLEQYLLAEQVSGELCDKCGWAMKFPEEPCRCELLEEIKKLKREAHREP